MSNGFISQSQFTQQHWPTIQQQGYYTDPSKAYAAYLGAREKELGLPAGWGATQQYNAALEPIIIKEETLTPEQRMISQWLAPLLTGYQTPQFNLQDFTAGRDVLTPEERLYQGYLGESAKFLTQAATGEYLNPEAVEDMWKKSVLPTIRETHIGTGTMRGGGRILQEAGSLAEMKYQSLKDAMTLALQGSAELRAQKEAMATEPTRAYQQWATERGYDMQNIANALAFLGIPMVSMAGFMPAPMPYPEPTEEADEGGSGFGNFLKTALAIIAAIPTGGASTQATMVGMPV